MSSQTYMMLISFLLLAIVIGSIAATVYTYIASVPIRSLADDLNKTTSNKPQRIIEYERIRSIIANKSIENEDLRDNIKKMEESLLLNSFIRLLYGNLPDEDSRSHLLLCCPQLMSVCRMLVVTVKDSEDATALSKKLKEVFSNKFIVRSDSYSVAVLLPLSSYPGRKDISSKISLITDVQFTYGISSRFSGLDNVTRAFWQAWYASKPNDNGAQGTSQSWSVAQKFYDLLISRKRDEFNKLLSEQSEISDNTNSDKMRALYSILSTVIECAAHDTNCIRPTLPSFTAHATIITQFEELSVASSRLFDELEKRYENSSNLKLEALVSYVDQNFTNYDINADTIASSLGISSRSVYKSVKEGLDCTLSEYIDMLRMKKASDMLLNTQLNINNISEMCGYSSTNTFYRAFKKHFVVTPSQYRSISK